MQRIRNVFGNRWRFFLILFMISAGLLGVGYSGEVQAKKAILQGRPLATPTPPPTPTPGATPTPPGPGCRNVLINGDFEGAGGWMTYSALGEPVISSFPPPSGTYHSGNKGAYLADYNNARDFIAQQVNIPVNATRVVLQYWWQVETQESTVRAYDSLTVAVDRPFGHAVEVLNTISNQDVGPVWHVSAHDLRRYRGRTVALRWEAQTDANRPTAFYVDDVTVLMCVGTTLGRETFLPLVAR